MPTGTYQKLLSETLPARIRTDAEYDRLYGRLRELFRQPRRRDAEQQLYDLLAVLIEDYDRRNALRLLTTRRPSASNISWNSPAKLSLTCCPSSASAVTSTKL